MYRSKQKQAFTLIELLMVIAIIGILAGILIPTVGAVRKQANIAASKSQLSNYVTAITLFKGEYGYLPFVTGASDVEVDLSQNATSAEFIETLSGRDPSNGTPSNAGGKNRRMIAFHSFSESEFYLNDSDVVDNTQLADRFNNRNIIIVIDGDGDGEITVKDSIGNDKDVKSFVSAYVLVDAAIGAPSYTLAD